MPSKAELAKVARAKAKVNFVETEHQVQARIVSALQLAGLTVHETTAYRQKGPSGVAKGIPDLLVFHPHLKGVYIGVEVKRPGQWTFASHEQRFAHVAGEFGLATSEREALEHVWTILQRLVVDTTRVYSVLRSFGGGQ